MDYCEVAIKIIQYAQENALPVDIQLIFFYRPSTHPLSIPVNLSLHGTCLFLQ